MNGQSYSPFAALMGQPMRPPTGQPTVRPVAWQAQESSMKGNEQKITQRLQVLRPHVDTNADAEIEFMDLLDELRELKQRKMREYGRAKFESKRKTQRQMGLGEFGEIEAGAEEKPAY